ncbi:MAG TPA: hypothetical protein VH107_07350 [Lacipirellulaceae bacterium]|nr:hypothetical protein [Lacipirellulaceae bacterium]
MADSQKKQAKGLTPVKTALIGVLAVVLVGVLYWNFSGAAPTAATNAPANTRRRPVTAVAKPGPATAAAKPNRQETKPVLEVAAVVDPAAWKSPNLTEVIAYDPFALPDTFPKARALDPKSDKGGNLVDAAQADDAKRMAEAVAQLETQLRELEQRGVQVIVRERDQYAAMIGDRIVHIGDEIDGFTVTGIDPTSGVRVERKSAK